MSSASSHSDPYPLQGMPSVASQPDEVAPGDPVEDAPDFRLRVGEEVGGLRPSL